MLGSTISLTFGCSGLSCTPPLGSQISGPKTCFKDHSGDFSRRDTREYACASWTRARVRFLLKPVVFLGKKRMLRNRRSWTPPKTVSFGTVDHILRYGLTIYYVMVLLPYTTLWSDRRSGKPGSYDRVPHALRARRAAADLQGFAHSAAAHRQ